MLCSPNNSIKHQSFVYTQLNDRTILFLTIHFSIIHLFVLSLNVKQSYLSHRQDAIRCYHSRLEFQVLFAFFQTDWEFVITVLSSFLSFVFSSSLLLFSGQGILLPSLSLATPRVTILAQCTNSDIGFSSGWYV